MTMSIRENDVGHIVIFLPLVFIYIGDVSKITPSRIGSILYIVLFQAVLAPFESADILGADLSIKSRLQRLPACIRSSQSQGFVC